MNGLTSTRCVLGVSVALFVVLLASAWPVEAQLNSSCTVSVLNRSVRVDDQGVWVLPNVPASTGSIRLRATCVDDSGATRSGQSDFFTIGANEVVAAPSISFDFQDPVPATLGLTAPSTLLTNVGESVQLTATSTYSDATTEDVTSAAKGTNYLSSNSLIASVSADGLVTAHVSGNVMVSAMNEGALAVLRLTVSLSGDSDGDGLPDDFEIANGLDPNDPLDVLDDPDADGLSTGDEFGLGLDPFDADSDDDGLEDGEELSVFGTDPLRFDTDGDQVSDGLEIQAGTDPLDPESFDISTLISGLEVEPYAFRLVFNTLLGEASRRVRVTAELIDGSVIDVTAERYGTTYASSDLSVLSFGQEDGRVFAGVAGSATLTVTNAGFQAEAQVVVENFSPQALAVLSVPGFANGVAVDGDYVFVAAGAGGLQVVDASDPADPWLAASLELPGNANDIALADGYAFVAAGAAGLQVIDVTVPSQPVAVGAVGTPGVATDVVVGEGYAYVADELGVRVVDVVQPVAPLVVGGVATPGRARGLALADGLLLVADSGEGLWRVDVADPAAPVLGDRAGELAGECVSSAAAVAYRDGMAYVADGAGSLGGLCAVAVEESGTLTPRGGTGNEFGLTGLSLDGGFALASDYFYVNAVPIFAVDGADLQFRAILDFSLLPGAQDDNGNDVATSEGLVFLVADALIQDNGVDFRSRLYIGRYLATADDAGQPPEVSLSSPQLGQEALERRSLEITAEATDDVRVERVDFLVEGQVVASDFTKPYSTVIEVPEAPAIILRAVAVDIGGNVGSSEDVPVTIIPDDQPVVSLLSPNSDLFLIEGTTVDLAANASDDQAVVAVDFWVGGVLVGTHVEAPYRQTYSIPMGSQSLVVEVRARDEVGQEATSGVLSFPVAADELPTAVLLEPSDGERVAPFTSIEVVAGAADDVGVARVDLHADGAVVGTDSTAPFRFVYQIPDDRPEVTLEAIAVEVGGRSTASAPVILEIFAEDPGTTVVGRVVDENGIALAGALVSCAGRATQSLGDGSFSIPDVPTAPGPFRCKARYSTATEDLEGTSALLSPVPGGVTDAGDLTLYLFSGYLYAGALIETGGGQTNAALGDLDGDGLNDLVSGGYMYSLSDGGINVQMGTPDGRFGPPEFYSQDGTRDLFLLDTNLDGALDVTAGGARRLWTLLGLGDGSLQSPLVQSIFTDVSENYRMASGMFNADGIPDVAARTNVLVGNGDGTWTQSAQLLNEAVYSLAVGDVDGDGSMDIVSVDRTNYQLSVRLGNWDGTFAQPTTQVLASRPVQAALGDVDGDGALDAVVANLSPDPRFQILKGGGDGSFAKVAEIPTERPPFSCFFSECFGVVLADLDEDGRLDLVSRYTRWIGVHRGNGDGSFEREQFYETAGASHVLVADVNFDGISDLLASSGPNADHYDWFGVTVLYGRGDATFASRIDLPLAGDPNEVLINDFNLDGIADVVAGDSEGLAVLIGLGGAAYREPVYYVGSEILGIADGDVDWDGDVDLVAYAYSGIWVLLNDGEGGFTASLAVNGGNPSLVLQDLNSDGRLDLVAGSSVYLGVGDGTFAAPVSSGATGAVRAGDLDGDSRWDLVYLGIRYDPVSGYYTGLDVLTGRGDGTFDPPVAYSVPSDSVYPVLGDFNGDSLPDVATFNDGVTTDVRVLLNQGGGTLGPATVFSIPSGSYNQGLVTADVNGDGALDLVTSNGHILLGDGAGAFELLERFAVGESPLAIGVGDLNGDGLPDFAVPDFYAGVSIFLHR